ncbi:DEAD/DEAH box helicase [Lactobacillus mulieris]|uniref:DEAD/DEAH box helicase n=1 Tax=Lactobacillus mulieris TaxID=2508708 RepID=A0AAW5WZZ2_9LACO|nr:DEAD/DEAH box helicase [Lactobacillus mulieris]MCZ3622582.1 DEAD/DEAH box helicase [Lactobacillus mulieris]MCZ3624220.1 DEAD/DEAH box helicase [Lactobacillus mulieris]MCZ3636589.1 DEAD/DEAH box helicase [Lactobacillus mulieris]MCZ3690350.1 DEAD/DEAH box helicase [Lactobacillus mulieris]MCZ3696319.1 DEAD/DEAH box helicase [Lactobacillus mulieris]
MYSKEIQAILTKEGKNSPTLIQKASYESLKNGANVIGLAKTGTGKTLAYSLPLLETTKPGSDASMVIFEPTTELAIQTRNAIRPYVLALGLNVLALVGSGNRSRQIEQLKKKKTEVLVVTPGRFFDLFSDNKIKLNKIQKLVIDEADDILEFTKLELLSSLGQNLPTTSQVVLFGATESSVTQEAEELFATNFFLIDVRPDQKSPVEHYFLKVTNRYKIQFLQRLVKLDGFKGILFFDSNETLEKFARIFSHSQTKFDLLTNNQPKTRRQKAINDLVAGKTRLLLATDLAARGLDIPKLTYVVNYELPEDENTYLHRAGRTGRMGHDGFVVTLGDDHDLRDMRKLLTGIDLKQVYFKGFGLSTEKPKKTEKKQLEKAVSSEVKKAKKHHKKRKRNQKNKGYHPRKEKK